MRSFRIALVLCAAALATPAFATDTTTLPSVGPPEATAAITNVAAPRVADALDLSAFKFTVSLVIPANPRQPRFKSPYIFDAIVVLYPEWAYFGSIWKKVSLSPVDVRDDKPALTNST